MRNRGWSSDFRD